PESIEDVLLLGELSLSGGMQSLRGVVAHLISAKARSVARAIVPFANEREASLVDGVDVELAATLADILTCLHARRPLRRPRAAPEDPVRLPVEDLADVRGQHGARRALEI